MTDIPDKSGVEAGKPLIGLRWVLVILMFSSYASTFFIRNSIGVTIVAMVNSTSKSDEVLNSTKDVCPAAIYKNETDSQTTDGEYNWTESEQGFVLGTYFWGFVISRLFFSRIAEKFGPRQTIFVSMTCGSLLALLSPLLASFSPYALATARFMTGILNGPFPAVFASLLSAWAPRSELSIMSTSSFAGATIGAMLGQFTSGWLTVTFGWRIVFYVGGIMLITVAPLWLIIARNSPFDHPWLSDYERNLLIENINIRTQKTVPWKKIFTSPYVIICIFCMFARSWLDVIFNTEGPSYFRNKIGVDLNNASYIIGISNLSSVIFMLIFGRISDFIVNKKYLSKIHARKMFHTIGTAGAVIVVLGLVLAKCSSTAAIILWISLGSVSSAVSCSVPVTIIDIAPNYTASVHSLLAIGNVGSALAPSVVAALLNQGNGWNKSFYLAAIINLTSLVPYVLFMTAEAQPWNFEEKKELSSDSMVYITKL